MAKEKSLSSEDKAAKKAAKAAKKESQKRSDTDGVHKPSSSSPTKSSKSSKAALLAEEAQKVESTTKLLNGLEAEKPGTVVVKNGDDDEGGNMEVDVKVVPLLSALVPFANPLADEKVGRKVLKGVKKANKARTLKRGVKEVVKSLRKSPASTTTTTSSTLPHSIVILAADISPMDVISHLPVLCEDHGVPYIFVTSRAELGAASLTKRPTSVVMIGREVGKGKKAGGEGKEGEEEGEWAETYADLVKVVGKAGRGVRI